MNSTWQYRGKKLKEEKCLNIINKNIAVIIFMILVIFINKHVQYSMHLSKWRREKKILAFIHRSLSETIGLQWSPEKHPEIWARDVEWAGWDCWRLWASTLEVSDATATEECHCAGWPKCQKLGGGVQEEAVPCLTKDWGWEEQGRNDLHLGGSSPKHWWDSVNNSNKDCCDRHC